MNSDLVGATCLRVAFYYTVAVFKRLKLKFSQCIFCLRFMLEWYLISRFACHYSIHVGLAVNTIVARSFFILIADSGKIALNPCVVNFTYFVSLQSFPKVV